MRGEKPGSQTFLRMMHNSIKLLLILLIIWSGSVADADIYQWVDKNGNIHITDNSTNIPDVHKQNMSVIKEGEYSNNVDNNKTPPIVEQKNIDRDEHKEKAKESEIDKRALETVLQLKWNSMKRALASGDIEVALNYYAEFSRASFRSQFTAIKSQLPTYVASMGKMRLVNVRDYYAECDLRMTIKDGTTYSFQVLFIREKDGVWRIMSY